VKIVLDHPVKVGEHADGVSAHARFGLSIKTYGELERACAGGWGRAELHRA
jgi:hypothetical protein